MRELRGELDHASVQKEVNLLVRVFSRFIISVVLSDMLDWSKYTTLNSFTISGGAMSSGRDMLVVQSKRCKSQKRCNL
jgi:hypothetical protein